MHRSRKAFFLVGLACCTVVNSRVWRTFLSSAVSPMLSQISLRQPCQNPPTVAKTGHHLSHLVSTNLGRTRNLPSYLLAYFDIHTQWDCWTTRRYYKALQLLALIPWMHSYSLLAENIGVHFWRYPAFELILLKCTFEFKRGSVDRKQGHFVPLWVVQRRLSIP